MKKTEEDIVSACKSLEAAGLNRGSSGNVSVRQGGDMLITPTAISYDRLAPDMIVRVAIDDAQGTASGSHAPSSEWRMHRAILRHRSEINAVVHTHAPFATILADAQEPIPAIHYMIAAFGGTDIPVAGYARYGTQALADLVLTALQGRWACLMANHGMIVGGRDLNHAVWLANELEALAHQHYHLRALGGGHILSAEDIAETAKGFETYGAGATEPL